MSAADSASKPSRMIVSLQVGGFFFALANVICVAILAWAYLSVKHEPRTLDVKGSAKKAITSDTISWTGTITARDPDLIKAYNKLKTDADHAAEFIKKADVPDKEVTFSSIRTQKIYEQKIIPGSGPARAGRARTITPPGDSSDQDSNPAQTIILPTQKVEMYVLSQDITIESHNMDKVPEVSRNITSLIKDGVEIESGSPSYTYSKLSELKIDMLADATKDATTRAEQIVNNAHGKLGKLVEAHMGVMQINPKGVTGVSDTGNNDTTSLEKEILAVVTVRFQLD